MKGFYYKTLFQSYFSFSRGGTNNHQLLLRSSENRKYIKVTRDGNTLDILCESIRDAVYALKTEKEWGNRPFSTVQGVRVETSEGAQSEPSTHPHHDDSGDSRKSPNHSLHEIQIVLGRSPTDDDTIKEELRSYIDHLVQEGLVKLGLAVNGAKDIIGILPSNMKTVNLVFNISGKHTLSEWKDFFSMLTGTTIGALIIKCGDSKADLNNFLQCFTQNITSLQINDCFMMLHGAVSAEKVMTVLEIPTKYQIGLIGLTVQGITSLTMLKSLLQSPILDDCSYEVGKLSLDALTEEECRDILENQKISHSPSLCELLKSLLDRVTDPNSTKPLYWPICMTVENVEYLVTNIFPLLEQKSEISANCFELHVTIRNGNPETRILKAVQPKSILARTMDFTLMALFFLPPSADDVGEHCRCHVINR